MNHIYHSIWNEITGTFVAVSENTRTGGGNSASNGNGVTGAGFTPKALAISLMVAYGSSSYALPVDGVLSAGSATITSGNGSMTVNQSSQNAALNWQSFNIGKTEAVRFVQPNSSSVALNRVIGADPSSILGSMSANGKVFLINPNGILFGKGASVNVGGLVASTRNISDSDFMAGKYHFAGSGNGSVLNQGSINADSGYVALLGANVSNEGTINARLGTVALAAGNAITLDVVGDGLLNVTVDQGAVHALVNNGGMIQADGGQVYLTAQAAGNLLQTVVNNNGVIQAQTIENHNGVIKLLGDMQSGTVNVGGKLDASAPTTGNGGFIETSAAHVKFADNAIVSTKAAQGLTGNWLIDPTDYTIAATGGDITGAALSANLNGSNITIASTSGARGANGDVNVNDTVTWSANKLTLNAQNNININTAMQGSGSASLALEYGQAAVASGNTSRVNLNAPVNLPAGNSLSTKLGSDGTVKVYTVITSLGAAGSTTTADLQGMNGNVELERERRFHADREYRYAVPRYVRRFGTHDQQPDDQSAILIVRRSVCGDRSRCDDQKCRPDRWQRHRGQLRWRPGGAQRRCDQQ
jgi:filamentous hemagglutinin family protein